MIYRPHSPEYKQFKVLRMASLALYAGVGMLAIASSWFLYTRMYQTIGQVENLTALSPVAGVQILRVDDYYKVFAQEQARIAHIRPQLQRDPFNAPGIAISEVVPISTTSTSTTVTSTGMSEIMLDL